MDCSKIKAERVNLRYIVVTGFVSCLFSFKTPYWKIMDRSDISGIIHFIYPGVSYILFLVDTPFMNNGVLLKALMEESI